MTTMDFIIKYKIIAIVRSLEPQATQALAEALFLGGIRLIEVTFAQARPETWKDTACAIESLAKERSGKVLAGAGTVLTLQQLHMAADAGAQYIISPDVNEEVIRETKRLGLVSLPGALTPTEIMAAHKAGADAVKVFPAGSLGPEYIKAIRAPLSHIPLLAVGGIDADNCGAFLKAGCVGVGVGGSLVNKQWIEAGEFEKITELAKVFVQNLSR